MKNHLKTIKKLALVAIMFFCVITRDIKAEQLSSTLKENDYKTTQNGTVIIDGEENELYKTFVDSETVLLQFSEKSKAFIKNCSKGRIESLNKENISDFIEMLFERIKNDNTVHNFFATEIEAFFRIYDIYENEEKNNIIMSIINNDTINNDEKRWCLYVLLPNYDPFVSKYQENRMEFVVRTSSFNITNAVTYAQTYAWIANTTDYHYYISGDCTNFASQILEAGGYPQNITGSQSTGWWHLQDGTNNSSNSWRLADVFCDYFGVDMKTSSHYLFSYNLAKGNFICFDEEKDGDWDHVAFVTQKDSYYSSSLGYYDYTVAQHTLDYHAKTSTAVNSWETLGSNGYWYGIIVID